MNILTLTCKCSLYIVDVHLAPSYLAAVSNPTFPELSTPKLKTDEGKVGLYKELVSALATAGAVKFLAFWFVNEEWLI